MVKCPSCEREWPENCEQAICVEKYGECIVCRFAAKEKYPEGSKSGTRDEIRAITAEFRSRKTK